jgi:L-fuconolactonase
MRFADAHIHLFREGYRRPGLPSLFGDRELQAYEALRLAHDIDLALAIGYEAEGIDPENNAYIRQLSQSRSWLKTLAFVKTAPPPEPAAVEALIETGHAGIAIYASTGLRLNRYCAGREHAGDCCNPARPLCHSILVRKPSWSSGR